MDRTFELGPNVATVTPTSLRVGQIEVPWTDILAVGISYMSHGRYIGGRTAILHLAYARRPTAKRTELIVHLSGQPAEDQEFVREIQRLVPGRWVGEGNYLAMRGRLGFSNALVFGVVAGISMIVLIAVVLIAVMNMGPKGREAPAHSPTKSQEQRGPR